MWLNGLVFKYKYYAPAQQPLSFLSQSACFFPVLAQQASPLEHLLLSDFVFLEQAVFLLDLQHDFSVEAHFFSVALLLQHPLFADFSNAFISDLSQDFSVEAHFCSILTSFLLVFVLCAKATFTKKTKVRNNNVLFIVPNFLDYNDTKNA